MQLDGKVAIVTGAASGLGRASCVTLAKAGVRIAAFDRDEARLAELCRELGSDALGRVVDVADEASVSSGVDAVLEAFGAVHIAVNCAGVADAAKTVSKGEPFPLATWNKVIGINLTGTFNIIRFAAVAMTRNEPGGGERRTWRHHQHRIRCSVARAGRPGGLQCQQGRGSRPHIARCT